MKCQHLRIDDNSRNLIDQAADLTHRTRTDFMLEAACREAKNVMLDRVYFSVDEDKFAKFNELLDEANTDNPRLRALMKSKSPWE